MEEVYHDASLGGRFDEDEAELTTMTGRRTTRLEMERKQAEVKRDRSKLFQMKRQVSGAKRRIRDAARKLEDARARAESTKTELLAEETKRSCGEAVDRIKLKQLQDQRIEDIARVHRAEIAMDEAESAYDEFDEDDVAELESSVRQGSRFICANVENGELRAATTLITKRSARHRQALECSTYPTRSRISFESRTNAPGG